MKKEEESGCVMFLGVRMQKCKDAMPVRQVASHVALAGFSVLLSIFLFIIFIFEYAILF